MGRVQTEYTSLLQSVEASLGVLAGTPTWKLLEPNGYAGLGSKITKVARSPISKTRQRRKGIIVDLDSSVEFECDVTLESIRDYAESLLFATFSGGLSAPQFVQAGTNFQSLAATTSAFTHSALSAAIPANRLVFVRGFTAAADNGLFVVDTGSTTTSTPILGGGLTAETPSEASGASMSLCGVRGATGDIQMNASGNLISTVLNFTTLGLTVGQFLKIGGANAANQFASATYNGTARVTAVAANLITLDKRSWTVGSADNGAGKNIDLLFGQFVRNVNVDDSRYIERSYTFEASMIGLQNPTGDKYIYPAGNLCNKIGLSLPLTAKAIMNPSFIGTDTPKPTTTRATNASTPIFPTRTAGFGTSSDIARLSLRDSTLADQSIYWKKLDLSVDNGVTPEKILALLGAKYMNVGLLQVDIDAQALFTDSVLLDAIRDNQTMSLDWLLKNTDGGAMFDLPSMTIGDGKLDLPRYKTVAVTEKCEAFIDATLGYTMSVSLFPYLP